MKLCLCMIVKNESKVIERCIESVKHLIDYWIIIDTGSTDNTVDIIRSVLKDINGTLIEENFVSFSANRSHYMEIARMKSMAGVVDYCLVMDADEVLIDKGFNKDLLKHGAYNIRHDNELDWVFPRILKASLAWRYEYVIHEIPVCDNVYISETLNTLAIDHRHDNGNSSARSGQNLELITKAAKDNPDDTRYAFYLANTYYDMSEWLRALSAYNKRAAMGGWGQEVFISLYRKAICHEKLGQIELAISSLFEAYDKDPSRPDSLYELGRIMNALGRYNSAAMFLDKAYRMPYPKDPLFFYRPIYKYLIVLELAVSMYYVGNHEEAIKLNDHLIISDVPAWVKELAAKNREFSIKH